VRRWETLTALVAVIVASASALPIPGRLGYALVAMALLALVGGMQLHRSLTTPRANKPGLSPEERARQIRAQRGRR
jgi:uncharacterized protein (DUF58 family)